MKTPDEPRPLCPVARKTRQEGAGNGRCLGEEDRERKQRRNSVDEVTSKVLSVLLYFCSLTLF